MSDLHEAADLGNAEHIHAAIRRGCDVNMADETFGGRTPLHLAAANGHTECVKILLRLGADPTVTMTNGWTPAHSAAETGSLGALMAIVEACPAANCADKYGDYPFHVARVYGHAKCQKFLQSSTPGEQ